MLSGIQHGPRQWDFAFGLTATDMRQGLASNAFRAAALSVKQTWCILLGDAFDPGVLTTQEHRKIVGRSIR
jgi:hypothetical protein